MQNIELYITIAVIAAPIVLAIARYVWNLGSVQAVVQKNSNARMINDVVDQVINSVHQWAGNQEAVTNEQKLAKAVELVKSTAHSFGIPRSMLSDEVIEGLIESAISKYKK